MTEKTYSVGIYCRLSNDDERDGESVSIENQRQLLQRYVLEQGWNLYDTYIDDGYSGTNFQRPGVQRLIEDAKAKRINVIIVKDLSRFGRNYIEFGQYTDYLFPSIGCRFIALGNGIDTANQSSSNDVMCFLNLFNEFYSRDTSKKVRAVRKACAEDGKFMGAHPPYGYQRDPENKHHLVIDEETAPVVRKIFEMRAAGTSCLKITSSLNEEGILPPGTVWLRNKGKPDNRSTNRLWGITAVIDILRNEVYIGNMVQGRMQKLSYKSKKIIDKPEDEWIRVEATHEPIVSRALWDTVVSIDQKKVRKRQNADGSCNMFTGLLCCADCGFKMRNTIQKFTYKDGRSGRRSSFLCGNYCRSGKVACSSHFIGENALQELVLQDIREKAQLVSCDCDGLIARILRLKDKENHSRLASYEQELTVTAARVRKLEKMMESLYADKYAGVIPQSVFQTLMQNYEAERAEKAARLPELEQKARMQRETKNDVERWAEIIQRYNAITELDAAMLFELVDRIEVGEVVKQGPQRFRDVKVVYRYVGNVDEAMVAAHG